MAALFVWYNNNVQCYRTIMVVLILISSITSACGGHHRTRMMTTATSRFAFIDGVTKQQQQQHNQQASRMISSFTLCSLQNRQSQFPIPYSSFFDTSTTKRISERRWNSRYVLTTPKKATTSLSATTETSNNNNNNDSDDRNQKQTTISSSSNTDVVGDSTEYANKNNVRDQVVSAISGDGGIKVTVCTARNIINDLMIQHTMTSISTQALGRTVMCGLLMSNGIQDEQNVQISIRTQDGPLRGVVAIVSGRGEVRGYVGTPMLGNDWTLEDAVGRVGSVQIVKNHPSWPRPYNGITAVRYGDIDRDVGIYLAESEQRSCALAAACSIQDNILCHAAGGYLVEILPDCADEVKQQVEENLANLVSLHGSDTSLPTNLLLNGTTPVDICSILLDKLDMKLLQQIQPVLKCDCTEHRLLRALRLLPRADVDEILEQQQQIEARCEFCGKVYRMEPDEVRSKMMKAIGDPSKDDGTSTNNNNSNNFQ